MTFLQGRTLGGSGFFSSRITLKSSRTIFPSAAAIRSVALADSSDARVSLWLRFGMGFDVYGCLIRVFVMRLPVKAALTLPTLAKIV